MALVRKTSKKGARPTFKAQSTPGVKLGKDGGKNLGTPTRCTATRAAGNVRSY